MDRNLNLMFQMQIKEITLAGIESTLKFQKLLILFLHYWMHSFYNNVLTLIQLATSIVFIVE